MCEELKPLTPAEQGIEAAKQDAVREQRRVGLSQACGAQWRRLETLKMFSYRTFQFGLDGSPDLFEGDRLGLCVQLF